MKSIKEIQKKNRIIDEAMQMQIVTDRDREEERKKFLSDLIGNNGVDN